MTRMGHQVIRRYNYTLHYHKRRLRHMAMDYICLEVYLLELYIGIGEIDYLSMQVMGVKREKI